MVLLGTEGSNFKSYLHLEGLTHKEQQNMVLLGTGGSNFKS